jgi:hypothetical protein
VIAEVDSEHITIMSRAFVCRPAYILGAGMTIGRFSSATDGGHGEGAQRPATGGGDIVTTAIPFLATVAAFATALRSARSPMIVGTTSEAVAWEILTAHATRGVPVEQSIAVLIGPGDDETGARMIAHLRRFDGAMFILDPSARALTFIPEQSTDGEWPDEFHRPATNGARYRDPARWHAACVVEGEPQIGLIETGARALIVRTGLSGDGRAWVPTDNIAIWPD